MDVHFNYSKLKGRIVEFFGTQENFARAMKISASALNNKLNGRSEFDQSEIIKALKLLEVEEHEVRSYFFATKS